DRLDGSSGPTYLDLDLGRRNTQARVELAREGRLMPVLYHPRRPDSEAGTTQRIQDTRQLLLPPRVRLDRKDEAIRDRETGPYQLAQYDRLRPTNRVRRSE